MVGISILCPQRDFMDTTDQKTPSQRRNRRHSDAFKFELVEQVRQTGMSVARVAREAGVNANQVFAWIKQHRDGTPRHRSRARLRYG